MLRISVISLKKKKKTDKLSVIIQLLTKELLRFNFQLLVVPVHSSMDMFSGTVEGYDRARQFEDLECLDRDVEMPDVRPREECADLLFSMSAIIHDGAQRKIPFFFVGDLLYDPTFEILMNYKCLILL